ncbi:MAG: hypothetical protein LKK13_02070 [Bacilli bacterium]|nr:hypothetical protein [Bacilli bacterium]
MKNQKIALVLALAALPLVACTKASSAPASSAPASSSSSSSSSSGEKADVRANGIYNYSAIDYADKNKILGAEEGYILDNFLGGIPLYDDGGTVLYNSRLSGLLDNYIPNYGFGVGRATINADLAGDPGPYTRYFHDFQTNDPGTFNAANSTDSVTSDMNDMFTIAYYDMKPNATSDGYEWYPVLASAMPIAVDADENGFANTWEVPVHADEDGFVYNTLSAKDGIKDFAGRRIQLEDYLTMYKLTLDNGWSRATDLGDATTGFAGVSAYSDAVSAGKTPSWDSVGIQIDAAKKALKFTFNTAKDPFYAMYYVSSSMYAPLPESFITAIGGADHYGIYNDTGAGASGLNAVDSVLSTGVYMPEAIEAGKQIIFKKNTTCCVSDEYHFAGYKYSVWPGAASDSTYAYTQYKEEKNLDAVAVPASKLSAEANNPELRKTKGSTVWKFQVNSCTQAEWNALFGTNGTIDQGKDNGYQCKPIMSNINFLNGLYASINRNELATTLGRNAAQGFFSGAYDYDPLNGLAYRDSDEGKAVLADRDPDTCGYNLTKAEKLFQIAIEQEQKKGNYTGGTAAEPVTITLDSWYQTTGQISQEGGLEASYLQNAFNEACRDKYGVELVIKNQAPAVWSDVYYQHMMVGQFDFGFGAISGNTLDPLAFCNTVCSDNRSGFTLSWGTDTSACEYDEETGEGSIMYDGKAWSFDALYEAGTAGAIAVEGESTPAFTYGEDSAGGQVQIAVASLDEGVNNAEFTLSYYVDSQVLITIDKVTWYNPVTKEEAPYDVDTVVSDDDNGTITINAPVDIKDAKPYDGFAAGIICVYYTQTVLGVMTTGLEIDVTVIFVQAA